MAVKTQAELLAEVQTILASNSQIRAVDHRTLENDIIDTMFGSFEPLVGSYTTSEIALLTGTLRQRVFNTTDNDYEWYDGTRWVKEAHPKYKLFDAEIEQNGANAPTFFIFEDNFGGIVWSYVSTGVYKGTLNGAFTTDKTTIDIQGGVGGAAFCRAYRLSNDQVQIETYDITGSPVDGVMLKGLLKIYVHY